MAAERGEGVEPEAARPAAPTSVKLFDAREVVTSRPAADKRITLELGDAAKALLAKEGFDPVFGARPLKRRIQRRVQDPLALKLLEGEFAEGDTVRVDAKGGELGFVKIVEAIPV
jgi:ATP-dependent Clp protease ATP-binding subunit ClpB